MKRIFIFLAILVVSVIAISDMRARLKELDEIAVKSPAQVEINKDLLKPSRERTRNFTTQEAENDTKRQNTLYNDKVKEHNLNTNDSTEKNLRN